MDSLLRPIAILFCLATLVCTGNGCFGRRQSSGATTPSMAHEPAHGNKQKAQAMVMFGTTAGQNGLHEDAAKYFKEAVKYDPTNVEAHHGLGLAYAMLKQLHAAIPEFQKAVELNPRFAEAYFNLGIAYNRMGQADMALEKWQTALKIDPNHGRTHQALGGYYFLQAGDIQKAVNYLLHAIRLMPTKKEPHAVLAAIYLKQGLYRSAAPELREVLKVDPRDTAALYQLGVVYHNENQLDQAAACYRKVLKLDQHHKDALVNLGSLHFQAGSLEQARAHFERAYALDPTNQFLASQLQKIGRLLQGRSPQPQ